MNKQNSLSKSEMKNVVGGLACPAWYQAQCIRDASNQESTGDPILDQLSFETYLNMCMIQWDYHPDNP